MADKKPSKRTPLAKMQEQPPDRYADTLGTGRKLRKDATGRKKDYHKGTATKLNGPLVNGGYVLNFQISPDSSRVVYRADQQIFGVFELFASYNEFKIYLPLIQK